MINEQIPMRYPFPIESSSSPRLIVLHSLSVFERGATVSVVSTPLLDRVSYDDFVVSSRDRLFFLWQSNLRQKFSILTLQYSWVHRMVLDGYLLSAITSFFCFVFFLRLLYFLSKSC